MTIRQQLGLRETLNTVAGGDSIGNNKATAIGGVRHNPGGDQLILSVQYSKGDEAGIYLYVVS